MHGPDQGISERDFRNLCSLIRDECGIVFGDGKRVMVEGRLRRRARVLGMATLAEYCAYVHSSDGRLHERSHLIDAVTTHKTDFYREPAHFEYLAALAIPELVSTTGAGTRRPLNVWSAACSTGQEPYTVAMTLSEYRRSTSADDFRFHVTGTDISEAVVETARNAVYPEEAVRPLPPEFLRYLLRSRDRSRGTIRIAPEIRSIVEFRSLNLMDTSYGFRDPFDVVFCRNVMIYFDRDTQAKILHRISRTLRPRGYLFMGHSESLCGFDLPLDQVSTTVYRRARGEA